MMKGCNYWISEARKYRDPKAIYVLVGNKCDLTEQRQVQTSEAAAFAQSNGMAYMETSAKENINIHETFQYLVDQVYIEHENNQ